MKRTLVYGASGHGKVVADAARRAGLEVVGFGDDDPQKFAIGFDEVLRAHSGGVAIALGVGANRIRRDLFVRLTERDVDIANTGCTIDHDNHIGDFAHVSPGAHLGGTVRVGAGTHVGIGASVRNNISIGAWTTIDAGASVVRDIPDEVVAVGVPARVIHAVPGAASGSLE
jgi:carbonic anhydrase/acetyltransferase-like protein (isoleucine patch superfamily)